MPSFAIATILPYRTAKSIVPSIFSFVLGLLGRLKAIITPRYNRCGLGMRLRLRQEAGSNIKAHCHIALFALPYFFHDTRTNARSKSRHLFARYRQSVCVRRLGDIARHLPPHVRHLLVIDLFPRRNAVKHLPDLFAANIVKLRLRSCNVTSRKRLGEDARRGAGIRHRRCSIRSCQRDNTAERVVHYYSVRHNPAVRRFGYDHFNSVALGRIGR